MVCRFADGAFCIVITSYSIHYTKLYDVGIRPDGTQYFIAYNAYSRSELAGVCFSPDGSILFVNIQYPGMTVAITGDWQTLQSG